MATSSQIPSAPATLFNLPEGLTPDSIDTIPILSALLSRLQDPATITTTSLSSSPPVASPAQLASGTGPLQIKDIPTATDDIKHKLQKARVQVKELPDIDRSIEEQEQEIKELEDKIEKQRAMLRKLKDAASAPNMNGGGRSDAMET